MSQNSSRGKLLALAPVGAWTAWIMLSMLALAPAVVGGIYRLFASSGAPVASAQLTFVLAISVYSAAIMVVMSLMFLLEKRPYPVGKWLGIDGKRLQWSNVADILQVYIGYFILSLLTIVVLSQVTGIDFDQSQETGFGKPTELWEFVTVFAALVILAPIAEEILFRGLLYGRLRRYIDPVPAAIVTSVAFGIVHQQLNVGIDVTILSLFLCYLREKTGTIWSGVIVHGLKNCVAYYILFIYGVG